MLQVNIGVFSKVHVESRFDALAELPFVSAATSAVRLPFSILVWLWETINSCCSRKPEQCLLNRKVAIIGIQRSLVQWIPFLGNYHAVCCNRKDVEQALSCESLSDLLEYRKNVGLTRQDRFFLEKAISDQLSVYETWQLHDLRVTESSLLLLPNRADYQEEVLKKIQTILKQFPKAEAA